MTANRLAGRMAIAFFACIGFLSSGSGWAQTPAPEKAAGGQLSIDLSKLGKPWTGDLDGMIERRAIRVLQPPHGCFPFGSSDRSS